MFFEVYGDLIASAGQRCGELARLGRALDADEVGELEGAAELAADLGALWPQMPALLIEEIGLLEAALGSDVAGSLERDPVARHRLLLEEVAAPLPSSTDRRVRQALGRAAVHQRVVLGVSPVLAALMLDQPDPSANGSAS